MVRPDAQPPGPTGGGSTPAFPVDAPGAGAACGARRAEPRAGAQ